MNASDKAPKIPQQLSELDAFLQNPQHLVATACQVLRLPNTNGLNWAIEKGLHGEMQGIMAFAHVEDRLKAFLLPLGERALGRLLRSLPFGAPLELHLAFNWMRYGVEELVDIAQLEEGALVPIVAHGKRRSGPVSTQHTISSAKDPLFAEIRQRAHSCLRGARGVFLAEGELLAQRAVEDRLPISWLLYTPEFSKTPKGEPLIEAARKERIPLATLSSGLMAKLTTSRPVPQIMAVVEASIRSLSHFHLGPNSILFIAENIHNPDNLGMTLRTADAAGVEGIVVVGQGGEVFHKNCVRAARGAVGRIPLLTCNPWPEMLRHLAQEGVQVIGATGRANQSMWDSRWSLPAALLVGNEQEGLTSETLGVCTHLVRIPMAPGQDSLNVGVAAGILLYQLQQNHPLFCSPNSRSRKTVE